MYKLCRHIKTNGRRCKSPVVTGSAYCYFHARVHVIGKARSTVLDDINLPVLEDPAAIQIAISQINRALLGSRIDARRAGLLLYSLQIASQNIERHHPDEDDEKTVESISQSSEGDDLAPELQICETGECTHCPERHTCDECDPDELEDDDDDEDESGDDEEGEEEGGESGPADSLTC
jgi:hypothetical protein